MNAVTVGSGRRAAASGQEEPLPPSHKPTSHWHPGPPWVSTLTRSVETAALVVQHPQGRGPPVDACETVCCATLFWSLLHRVADIANTTICVGCHHHLLGQGRQKTAALPPNTHWQAGRPRPLSTTFVGTHSYSCYRPTIVPSAGEQAANTTATAPLRHHPNTEHLSAPDGALLRRVGASPTQRLVGNTSTISTTSRHKQHR